MRNGAGQRGWFRNRKTKKKKKRRQPPPETPSNTADLSDSVDISKPLWQRAILKDSGRDSCGVENVTVTAGALERSELKYSRTRL